MSERKAHLVVRLPDGNYAVMRGDYYKPHGDFGIAAQFDRAIEAYAWIRRQPKRPPSPLT